MKRSIRGKLWLTMMALVGITLLLLWLLQVVFLESFYAGMRVAGIKDDLIAIGRAAISTGQQATVFELDRIAADQNLQLEWFTADGQIVYQSAAESAGQMMMHNQVRVEFYRQVQSGEQIEASLTHPRFDTKYSLLGLPLFAADGSLAGGIMATIPLAPVAETAAILRRQLLYITGLLLAATSLLSFWLAKSLTRPILQIRQVSAAMAEGDFSARTSLSEQDEIGALASSINHLGERLAKIEQLRRDLVANVSHELRTPLSVIRGYAETIRDISGDQPARRAVELEIIIDETERLTGMVNDNLQLALLQSGNAEVRLRPVPLRELLEATVARYSVIAAQSQVNLNLQAESDASVQADEAKLEQVIRNLVQNSLQHTGAGGEITVSLVELGDCLRASVRDTGAGIAATDLPYVWDKYYQGQSQPNAAKNHGTGLGLAIVKGILDAHQARYGVESELGHGTTVWFELTKYQ